LNRNGHYYFRIAVPLSLRPNLGQRELLYSLKTKDLLEARTRSWAILTIVQGLFRDAGTGQTFAGNEIRERLNTLDFLRRPQAMPVLVPMFPAPGPKAVVPYPASDDKLSAVFEEYLTECKSDGIKTIGQKRAVLSLWLEINGDTAVTAMNKEQARRFKLMLMRLPANLKQRYPGMLIRDIDLDSIPDKKRLSVKTINNRLVWMSAFTNWAIKNGLYEAANPFSGLSLKEDESPETKKDAFSDDQLKAIFSTPVYTGCKSATMHDRYEQGEIIIRDGFYWVPLIALYSGARMQEICQLYVTDIRRHGEIWAFDFNDDGADKQLKTPSSKRKTPLHPKLIEMGLMDYLNSQAKNGHKRLFPDLPQASDGTYSGTFSKRYNHFLKRFNIKTDKTSFHSFRHTFIDGLRNTEVHKEVRQALVGHLDKQTAHDNYGSAIGLQRLYEGIVKLDYKNVPLILCNEKGGFL
jgi:integrase